MLELDKLSEITFNMLKDAVDYTISNKIFVRNCIPDNISDLPKEDQLNAIKALCFHSYSHILIKTTHHIEWTPVKLYLTGYYIVNLYNKYWLITNQEDEGFRVRSYTTLGDYIKILYNDIINNNNIAYLEQIYWCNNYEMSYGLKFLEQNPTKNIVLMKHSTFINSTIIINHFLFKNDDKIYYFPIANNYVYKPIIYKP